MMKTTIRWMFLFVLTITLIAFSFISWVPRTLTNNSLLVKAAATPTGANAPVYAGYKGVQIGMIADEARKKLGTPREKADDKDYFVFSDNESVQIYYDAAHAVTTISVNYIGNMSAVPKPKDVFGIDAEAKPDGSISKMVRYTKAGYWVSYNRTAGEDPIVMITMQKINGPSDN
jgi:hypothetical protein